MNYFIDKVSKTVNYTYDHQHGRKQKKTYGRQNTNGPRVEDPDLERALRETKEREAKRREQDAEVQRLLRETKENLNPPASPKPAIQRKLELPPSIVLGCYGGGNQTFMTREIMSTSLRALPKPTREELVGKLNPILKRQGKQAVSVDGLNWGHTLRVTSRAYGSEKDSLNMMAQGLIFKGATRFENLQKYPWFWFMPVLGVNTKKHNPPREKAELAIDTFRSADQHIHTVDIDSHLRFGSDMAKVYFHRDVPLTAFFGCCIDPESKRAEMVRFLVVDGSLEAKVEEIVAECKNDPKLAMSRLCECKEAQGIKSFLTGQEIVESIPLAIHRIVPSAKIASKDESMTLKAKIDMITELMPSRLSRSDAVDWLQRNGYNLEKTMAKVLEFIDKKQKEERERQVRQQKKNAKFLHQKQQQLQQQQRQQHRNSYDSETTFYPSEYEMQNISQVSPLNGMASTTNVKRSESFSSAPVRVIPMHAIEVTPSSNHGRTTSSTYYQPRRGVREPTAGFGSKEYRKLSVTSVFAGVSQNDFLKWTHRDVVKHKHKILADQSIFFAFLLEGIGRADSDRYQQILVDEGYDNILGVVQEDFTLTKELCIKFGFKEGHARAITRKIESLSPGKQLKNPAPAQQYSARRQVSDSDTTLKLKLQEVKHKQEMERKDYEFKISKLKDQLKNAYMRSNRIQKDLKAANATIFRVKKANKDLDKKCIGYTKEIRGLKLVKTKHKNELALLKEKKETVGAQHRDTKNGRLWQLPGPNHRQKQPEPRNQLQQNAQPDPQQNAAEKKYQKALREYEEEKRQQQMYKTELKQFIHAEKAANAGATAQGCIRSGLRKFRKYKFFSLQHIQIAFNGGEIKINPALKVPEAPPAHVLPLDAKRPQNDVGDGGGGGFVQDDGMDQATRDMIARIQREDEELKKRNEDRGRILECSAGCGSEPLEWEMVFCRNTDEKKRHHYCLECFKGMVNAKLQEGKIEVPCLPGCKNFTTDDLYKIPDEKVHQNIERVMQLKNKVAIEKKEIDNKQQSFLVACIKEGCNYYEDMCDEKTKQENQKWSCRKCNTYICFSCDPPVKLADSVSEYWDKIDLGELKEHECKDDIERNIAELLVICERNCYTITCGACNSDAPLTKDDGCHVVTCPDCKVCVCFMCSKDLGCGESKGQAHNQYPHDNGIQGRGGTCTLFWHEISENKDEYERIAYQWRQNKSVETLYATIDAKGYEKHLVHAQLIKERFRNQFQQFPEIYRQICAKYSDD